MFDTESGKVLHIAVGLTFFTHQDNDRKGSNIHEGIGEHVEQDSGGTGTVTGGKTDQSITGMGNRGVGQHALDVVLAQCCDVTNGHRNNRQNPQNLAPLNLQCGKGNQEDTQCGSKTCGLGAG